MFLAVTGSSVYYTGVKKAKVASFKETVTLKPQECKRMLVKYEAFPTSFDSKIFGPDELGAINSL